jgi:hypothetical protein
LADPISKQILSPSGRPVGFLYVSLSARTHTQINQP